MFYTIFLIQQHGHFYVFNQLGLEVDVGATQNYLVCIMPFHQTKKYWVLIMLDLTMGFSSMIFFMESFPWRKLGEYGANMGQYEAKTKV